MDDKFYLRRDIFDNLIRCMRGKPPVPPDFDPFGVAWLIIRTCYPFDPPMEAVGSDHKMLDRANARNAGVVHDTSVDEEAVGEQIATIRARLGDARFLTLAYNFIMVDNGANTKGWEDPFVTVFIILASAGDAGRMKMYTPGGASTLMRKFFTERGVALPDRRIDLTRYYGFVPDENVVGTNVRLLIGKSAIPLSQQKKVEKYDAALKATADLQRMLKALKDDEQTRRGPPPEAPIPPNDLLLVRDLADAIDDDPTSEEARRLYRQLRRLE